MKYRMLPRARSWVGWDAPAPCVVRECARASLETGSFKTRLGPSGPRAPTERTCLTCVLNWSVYWDCVLVVCPTWIRVSGSLLCVWGALPTELCVWRSCVCRRQVCFVKYLGVQRQDGNGEWCPLSVTWGVFTSGETQRWSYSNSSLWCFRCTFVSFITLATFSYCLSGLIFTKSTSDITIRYHINCSYAHTNICYMLYVCLCVDWSTKP